MTNIFKLMIKPNILISMFECIKVTFVYIIVIFKNDIFYIKKLSLF